MTRLTEWVDRIIDGQAMSIRVCVSCDHGPGFHRNPKDLETFSILGGCTIDGCTCCVTLHEITVDDTRFAEEEAEAELARERAEAEFWCEDCQEAVDEPDTRYECGNCGAEFGYQDIDSNRCPDCGKFASKTSDNACPTCGEELQSGGEQSAPADVGFRAPVAEPTPSDAALPLFIEGGTS
jgi:DNA-directed RNA polymerase subunit RPC12/RpoP